MGNTTSICEQIDNIQNLRKEFEEIYENKQLEEARWSEERFQNQNDSDDSC